MKIVSKINKFRTALALLILPEYMRANIAFAGKVLVRMAEETDFMQLIHAIALDRKISVFIDVTKEKDSACPPN